jgi:DNA-binding transcriptional ArsR family regulator
MGLFDDILKGLPENAVLRDKVREAEAKNAAIETENAILKDDLREAQAENKRLKEQIQSLTHTDDLHEIQIKIIKLLAQKLPNCRAAFIAESLQAHPTEIEFHLGVLEKQGYVTSRRMRPTIGPYFYYLKQKGKEYAVKNNLL